MQDLARFLIAGGIIDAGLALGQEAQHAPRQPWFHHQHLASGDQAVTAEGTAEPGNPRVGVEPMLHLGGQQVHIGKGAHQPAVEGRVVADHGSGDAPGVPEPLDRGGQRGVEVRLRVAQRQGRGMEISTRQSRRVRRGSSSRLRARWCPRSRRMIAHAQDGWRSSPSSPLYTQLRRAWHDARTLRPRSALRTPRTSKMSRKSASNRSNDRYGPRPFQVAGEAQLLQAGLAVSTELRSR